MEVVPLKEDGKEITESDDIFVENPSKMVSERLNNFLDWRLQSVGQNVR